MWLFYSLPNLNPWNTRAPAAERQTPFLPTPTSASSYSNGPRSYDALCTAPLYQRLFNFRRESTATKRKREDDQIQTSIEQDELQPDQPKSKRQARRTSRNITPPTKQLNLILDLDSITNSSKKKDNDPVRTERQARIARAQASTSDWNAHDARLYTKLQLRGLEPLMPKRWEADFAMLPAALFTPFDDDSDDQSNMEFDKSTSTATKTIPAIRALGRDPLSFNATAQSKPSSKANRKARNARPTDLENPNDDGKESTDAKNIRATRALLNLLDAGLHVRDLQSHGRRTGSHPESIMKRAIDRYLAWSLRDAGFTCSSAVFSPQSTSASASTSVSDPGLGLDSDTGDTREEKGNKYPPLVVTTEGSTRASTTALRDELASKMVELREVWVRYLNERSTSSSLPSSSRSSEPSSKRSKTVTPPPIYGVVCSGPAVLVVGLKDSTGSLGHPEAEKEERLDTREEENPTKAADLLRVIVVLNWSDAGQDVWNALAIALLAAHVRDVLLEFRDQD